MYACIRGSVDAPCALSISRRSALCRSQLLQTAYEAHHWTDLSALTEAVADEDAAMDRLGTARTVKYSFDQAATRLIAEAYQRNQELGVLADELDFAESLGPVQNHPSVLPYRPVFFR